jgi:predicted Zn-dependent peptidase
LEHKLFENEDGSDSFARFSSLGADANAYTSYNKTAYLFSCTENFEESLEELLRFVTHPHFTQKSVQKEIGIISEEIRMTEDNPWDRGFQLLLEALYHHHPVRKSICGTQESIRAITPEALYACYRAFYDPSQMSLVVCGDVSVEDVQAVADRVLPPNAREVEVKRILPDEPKSVCQESVRTAMQVSKPIFFMGFKDVSFEGDVVSRLRRDAAMTLLGEILFSRSGEFYNSLFESGKITPSFSAGYSIAESFAFYCLSGEADHPEEIFEAVLGAVERVKKEGISTEDLERCRRVMYADEVRAYDSTEEIANRLLSFALEGGEIFSYPDLIEAITREELTALLDEVFCKERLSVSIIDPLAEQL